MKVEDSIDIAKPQEFVFSIVRDLERAPEWQPSLESVDVQAGTEVRRVAGRRQTRSSSSSRTSRRGASRCRRRAGRPRHARLVRSRSCRRRHRGVFSLDVQLRGAARFAGPLVKSTAHHEVRSTLEKLKEFAER